MYINFSICAPFQIAVCLFLIYQQVGASTFVGLGYTIITTPIIGFIFGVIGRMRQQKMRFTDARVKMMNEVLAGIRIIKYYAWEKAFVLKKLDKYVNKRLGCF